MESSDKFNEVLPLADYGPERPVWLRLCRNS
jgi:hypothetical protein